MLTLLLASMLTSTLNIQQLKAEKKPKPQGFSPFAIAITEDGEHAYISFCLSEEIFKVRLKDLSIEAVADLSEYFPLECQDVTLDASEKKLFVYTPTWRKLIVLNTQTMNVIHTIDDIEGISGRVITRSQYGPYLITWDGGNTVRLVNTETYEVTEFTDDEMEFRMIQESKYDQSQWYVISGDPSGLRVGIYDHGAKAWNYSVSIPVNHSHDLEVLPNEQKLYVAVLGGWYPEYHAYGWLYSVDLVGREVKVVPIDGGALCLESSPDSRWLYVGTGWPVPDDNNLLVVDTKSDNITGQIYLGQNKYERAHTQMNRLQIDPANPHLLYATCTDANTFIKVDLDNLTVADMMVLNEETFGPHFFVKRPMQATGYVLILQSANAFELDVDQGAMQNVVEFPKIREDVYAYDVAIDDAGRLFIAQGETILEVDVEDMGLLGSHPLPPDISGLWSFVLSSDQTKLYSVWHDPHEEGWSPDTFLAINTINFQVEARFRLEGGVFADKPYELPDGSKVYALGGQHNGPVVIHVIETENYTIQKTITFDEHGLIGISAGLSYPFAYDSSSHTLFVGATHVVLAIDTDTDVIKKVIYLGDAARAIGLEPWQLTYVNAVGLVYHAQENDLYIAHVDRSFVSIYDLNNDKFLPQVIPLGGYFPTFLFANDDCSKIYCLNARSDSISVIDVDSKTEEKVVDLHTYLDVTPPLAEAGENQMVDEDTLVTLDGSCSTDNVEITSYTWTFKDVTTQTLSGATVTYNFTNPEIYVVTLNVTDASGNSATDNIMITVNDITPPVADAGSDQAVKINREVSFDASGSSDNVKIVTYDWNFGDGNTASGKTAVHTYKELGIYTVTLTVKDKAENSATDTITVTVEEEPGFPVWIVAGIGAATVAIIAVLLIIRKRVSG